MLYTGPKRKRNIKSDLLSKFSASHHLNSTDQACKLDILILILHKITLANIPVYPSTYHYLYAVDVAQGLHKDFSLYLEP